MARYKSDVWKVKFILPLYCASKYFTRVALRSVISEDLDESFEGGNFKRGKVSSDMKDFVALSTICKFMVGLCSIEIKICTFVCAYAGLSHCRPFSWPIFPPCAASTPLGQRGVERGGLDEGD